MSDMKQGKGIRYQIHYAKQGVLLSQLQMYENYLRGKSVEQDLDKANEYLELLEDTIVEKRISLESLSLFNFRRFSYLNVGFNERLTVIIGDNGSGKTSFADAISKVFAWFNNNLEKDNVNGSFLKAGDVNVSANDYSEITCAFQLDKKNKFDASLALPVPGAATKSNSVNVIKKIASIYRIAKSNKSVTIPIFAYYPVERSNFELRNEIVEKAFGDGVDNRFSALKDALHGSGRLDDFSQKYIELVNLANGEDGKEVIDLKNQIKQLQDTIDDVYQGRTLEEDDPFALRLSSLKAQMSEKIQSSSSGKYKKHLSFVNRAIETLVPDVRDLEVDRSTGKPRILVKNFGSKVNITQLSQGQKMLVALTGDLAWRLVTLNPDSENPLHGHGIVVIDEVELHLHPRWQQSIIIGLQTTFPNIQFILTTHSPQILSTVDHNCIRKICADESGNLTVSIPSFQTKGVTSASILARIMGTNSVPEHLEEAIWLTDFSRSLKDGDEESRSIIFEKIKAHFGEKHPVVVDCESQVRIYEMKKRLGNK